MPDAVTLGLIVTAAVIVVVVTALLFQRAPVKRKPPEGPAAAMLALAHGQRARALEILRRVAREHELSVETTLVLGHLLREHGETGQALHVHHGLLGRTGLEPEQRRLIELQIVDDLMASGHDQRAEERLAELDEHYEDADILERRAMALIRLHRRHDAIDVLRRRAVLDDEGASAWAADALAEIAREELRDGNTEAALRTAKLAVATDPTRPAGYTVIGDAQHATGLPDEGTATWIEGLRHAPGGGEMLLGRVLEASLRKGRLESLVDVMESLRARRPDDYWLWRAAADLRLRRGDRDEFFALLDDPPPGAADTLAGWTSWIRHLHGRGDQDELRRLLALLPDGTGPRHWRCPSCGREDEEPRAGCGQCGHVGPLRPVVPEGAAPVPALSPPSIPGGRLQ